MNKTTMQFNPYQFDRHFFIIKQHEVEPEFALFDSTGAIITCTDYSLEEAHFTEDYNEIEILGPSSGIPAPIIIASFETWLVDNGYFGGESKQRPLPPGSIIKYAGFEATVIEDDGGPELVVECDGETQVWKWAMEDLKCEVVSIPNRKSK